MKRLLMLALIIALLLSACSAPVIQTSPSLSGHTVFDPATDSVLSHAHNYDVLMSIYANSQKNSQRLMRAGDMLFAQSGQAPTGSADESKDGAGSNYSTTNIQVAGVDEADIIKTDGSYLYVIANNRLYIIDAQDPAAMTLLSTQVYNTNLETGSKTSSETPITMFLDVENQRLILITAGWTSISTVPGETGSGVKSMMAPDYYFDSQEYTTTRVFDLTDKTAPALVRQFTQTGYFLDARKIGSDVYIITNEYNYPMYAYAEDGTINTDDLKPEDVFPATSCDFGTVDPTGLETIPADKLAILPRGDVNNQLVIAGIDSLNDNIDPNVLGVLGTSGTVYCSTDYLYVASYNYPWVMTAMADDVMTKDVAAPVQEMSTDIFRFKLDHTKISEAGQGSVPGYILNQYSMDENNGYFRIATTTGEIWATTEAGAASNNVYILDANLEIAGQVTGLAPNESIKSVRFMGDKAYVVTFRNVDPLFVVDLTNPTAPSVLGQLKIPGYSTYLHPYADNMLLGFGYDVKVEGDNAYNAGIKVSLFDISDFSNPRELSNIVIGGRGSYSELLYNAKALLFSREKNIIAFPATLNDETSSVYEYGKINWQGLVVMSVGSGNKLVERGSISHIDTATAMSEDVYYGPSAIFRGAFIDNVLFTFSNNQVRSSRNSDFSMIGSLGLPGFIDYTVVTPGDGGTVEPTMPIDGGTVDPVVPVEGGTDGSSGVATDSTSIPAA